MFRKVLFLVVSFVLFSFFATPALAAAPYSCTTSQAMDSCHYGWTTFVNNEVWNPPAGFTNQTCEVGSAAPCQTISANGPDDWKVTANYNSTSGAIISYPDTQQLYSDDKVVVDLSSLTSSYRGAFTGNSATSTQEAAYDIWLNNWSQELMVWVDTTPSMRKALNYDTLKASNVSVGGFNVSVYCNGPCPGSEIIVSLNENHPTGTIDIKAVVKYLEDSGWMKTRSTLTAIDFGAEFASTGGAFNSYTLSCYNIVEDAAAKPCETVTSTLMGSSTIAVNIDGNVKRQAQAFQYIAAASGTSKKINLYVDASSTATSAELGIYSDKNGRPNTLLRKVTFAPRSGQWNSVDLSLSIIKGTRYWVAELGTSGVLIFRDTANGALSPGSKSSTLTTLPTNWESGPTWNYGPASLFLN
jgi:hypothetical protein